MFLFKRKTPRWFDLVMKVQTITTIIPPLRGARGVLPIACSHAKNTPRAPLKGGIVSWQFAIACAFFLASFSFSPNAFAQATTPDSLRAQESISLAPIKPKKNPNAAVLRSLLVPGWGQYYNGQKWKAALVAAAELGEIGTAIYWHRESKRVNDDHFKLVYEDYRNAAYWFLAGTIILSMLDAYVDAQLSDFDESPSLDDRTLGTLAPPPTLLAIRFKIRL